MKITRFFLAVACALCSQAAFAQTATQSTPNMQSASSTNTGTQTSSPTTTGMNNDMVTPPAQTRERMVDDQKAADRRNSGTMTRTKKTKTYDGKGKMKTKM
jgi:hypothetical protein